MLGLLFFILLYSIEKYIAKEKRIRFFTRIGISFIVSGVLILLVFAYETIKIRYYDFKQADKFFSYYANQNIDFLIAGRKAKIKNSFKKKERKLKRNKKEGLLQTEWVNIRGF